jgi:hypothetical protein
MAFYKLPGEPAKRACCLIIVFPLVVLSGCSKSGETKQAALERCRAKAKNMKSVDYVAVLKKDSKWVCSFGAGSG